MVDKVYKAPVAIEKYATEAPKALYTPTLYEFLSYNGTFKNYSRSVFNSTATQSIPRGYSFYVISISMTYAGGTAPWSCLVYYGASNGDRFINGNADGTANQHNISKSFPIPFRIKGNQDIVWESQTANGPTMHAVVSGFLIQDSFIDL